MGQRTPQEPALKDLLAKAQSEAGAPEATDLSKDDALALARKLADVRADLGRRDEELRATKLELWRVRDRYRQLYDFAPVGYFSLDRKTTILECNLTGADLLGCERVALVGQPLSTFMTQDDANVFKHHLQRVFAQHPGRGCNIALRREDPPGVVLVHIDSVAFAQELGDEPICHSVVIDRTALRTAQAGLRRSEAGRATILDTVADAVITTDPTGRIEAFNQAAETLFGYLESEVVGVNIQTLAKDPQSNSLRLIGGGSETGREVVAIRKGGDQFPAELGMASWHDQGKRMLTSVLRDISERRNAEQTLRDSETRFRTLAEHLVYGVAIIDRERQHCLFANAAFERIVGRIVGPRTTASINWLELVAPKDRSRVARSYAAFLSDAHQHRFDQEYTIQRPDEEVRRVRMRVFPSGDSEGQKHDIALVQDVTAEHHLSENLRQAQKMEALGVLASGVAHDFNNVLQAIVGCINVAQRQQTPSEQRLEHLARAVGAARSGGQLAAKLMGFARKRDTRPRQLELDPFVDRMSTLLQRLVTEEVSVEIQLAATGCLILADPVQLEQILLNLAANARDAMGHGGTMTIRTDTVVPDEALATRLGARAGDRWARLRVTDIGAGIDERNRDRIFEPFFTTKEVGEGTGLGLATVFAVTKQLGGHIDVVSEPGRGTTFTVHFPCVKAQLMQRRCPGSALPRFSGNALLVEDQPEVRTTIRQFLEALGFEVQDAKDADEARAWWTSQKDEIELLVSDVILPGARGPAVAAALRARYPNIRTLFITANPELVNSEEVEAPVLQKPFTVEDLAASLLDIYREAPQLERTR